MTNVVHSLKPLLQWVSDNDAEIEQEEISDIPAAAQQEDPFSEVKIERLKQAPTPVPFDAAASRTAAEKFLGEISPDFIAELISARISKAGKHFPMARLRNCCCVSGDCPAWNDYSDYLKGEFWPAQSAEPSTPLPTVEASSLSIRELLGLPLC